MKYGFIYLWRDSKHNRFYLGRHWGTEDDGYVCSSKVMREAYRRRPTDFKRRIVSRVYEKDVLIDEEQRWLNMIRPSEVNIKYYNKTLKSTTPSTKGYNHSKETRLKISKGNKGKIRSDEFKEKLSKTVSKQFSDPDKRKNLSEKVKALWNDKDYVKKVLLSRKKSVLSDEVRKMRSDNMKRINASRWNKTEG